MQPEIPDMPQIPVTEVEHSVFKPRPGLVQQAVIDARAEAGELTAGLRIIWAMLEREAEMFDAHIGRRDSMGVRRNRADMLELIDKLGLMSGTGGADVKRFFAELDSEDDTRAELRDAEEPGTA